MPFFTPILGLRDWLGATLRQNDMDSVGSGSAKGTLHGELCNSLHMRESSNFTFLPIFLFLITENAQHVMTTHPF